MSEENSQVTRLHIQSDLDEPVIAVASSISMKPATKDNPIQFVIATDVSITFKAGMLGELALSSGPDAERQLAISIARLERTIHEERGQALQQEANRRLQELLSGFDDDNIPF